MPHGQATCLSFPCPYKFPPDLCKPGYALMPAPSHATGDTGQGRGLFHGMAGGALATSVFLLLSVQWCWLPNPWPHHARDTSWLWSGFAQVGMGCFMLVGQNTIIMVRIKLGVDLFDFWIFVYGLTKFSVKLHDSYFPLSSLRSSTAPSWSNKLLGSLHHRNMQCCGSLGQKGPATLRVSQPEEENIVLTVQPSRVMERCFDRDLLFTDQSTDVTPVTASDIPVVWVLNWLVYRKKKRQLRRRKIAAIGGWLFFL